MVKKISFGVIFLLLILFIFNFKKEVKFVDITRYNNWSKVEYSDKREFNKMLDFYINSDYSNYLYQYRNTRKVSFKNLDNENLTINLDRSGIYIFKDENIDFIKRHKISDNFDFIHVRYISMESGESYGDVSICDVRCVDVSAWFYINDFLKDLNVKESINGFNSVMLGKLVNESLRFDKYFIYGLKYDADQKSYIQVTQNNRSKEYTEKDRVYLKGTRFSFGILENCYGYVNYKDELYSKENFTYLCFNNKYKIFSGDSKFSKIISIHLSSIDSKSLEKVMNKVDLLDNLKRGEVKSLKYFAGAKDSWLSRHTKY